MQESSKSFLIKDLLRDLVHNVDTTSQGMAKVFKWKVTKIWLFAVRIEKQSVFYVFWE